MSECPPGRRALVLGARSVIAQALARRLAAAGWSLVLAARRSSQLEPVAADLRLRYGCEAAVWEFDATDLPALEILPQQVHSQCGEFHLVITVFGYLGDQERVRRDSEEMTRTLLTNFAGAAVALGHLANYLEERPCACGIIGITSVAGDRGRQSNYFYGAAKGGLALYLQGLRNRLAQGNTHVLTVKPGFVDTPMTEDLPGMFLVASPERVVSDILRAYQQRRDVVYTPWFWRYIMLLIRLIPERLFKRLRL